MTVGALSQALDRADWDVDELDALIVASALMSLGMMMLSPTIISMPFKLLLFVLVDGWALTMGSLAASFGT